MRFPLRLTADLTTARIAKKLSLAPGLRAIHFVDAAEVLHPDSSHPVSHEKICELTSSRSPAVWVGGSEPLHHPGISHMVRAITQSGHFVFLETDATLLRLRIHEFQPVPRLFFALRLNGLERSPDLHPGRSGSFQLAMEGIRVAKLSGFFLCVHSRIDARTQLAEIADLVQFAKSLDVDGFVISTAEGALNTSNNASDALRRKVADARRFIGNPWWQMFSRLVDRALHGQHVSTQDVKHAARVLEQEVNSNEEGVKVA